MTLSDLEEASEKLLPIGTIILWRHDHKRLLQAHIMALTEWMCSYARLVVDGRGILTQTNLDYVCTRSNFEWFWPQYIQKEGWSDRNLPLPICHLIHGKLQECSRSRIDSIVA